MLDSLRVADSGIPIYIQLRDQVLAAIGRGVLAPGARLPTMREVAVTLKIDLNTVQRAYAELEREGAVTMVQGRGSFVAETPPPAKNARKEAQTLALQVAAQAHASGIALDDLVSALATLAEKSHRKAGGRK